MAEFLPWSFAEKGELLVLQPVLIRPVALLVHDWIQRRIHVAIDGSVVLSAVLLVSPEVEEEVGVRPVTRSI